MRLTHCWMELAMALEPIDFDLWLQRKNEMKLNPIRDVVIIERDPRNDKSAGGIELPVSYKDDPAGTDEGVVVAVNRAYTNENGTWHSTDCFVGDRVIFMKKHAIAVKGSKTMVCVRNVNLLAVVE